MIEPRVAAPTIKFVDDYCEWYRQLFPEVRSFEAFKYLHVGMISEIKRKSLPAIAKIVGLNNEHSLTSFFNRITVQSIAIEGSKIKLNFICVIRARNRANY